MRSSVVLLAACGALGLAVGTSSGQRAAPTVSLAPVADAYVTAAIPGANFGSSKRLVIAHRPELAELADRIVRIEDGRVVEALVEAVA